MEQDLNALAERFRAGMRECARCGLYVELCRIISQDEILLRIAAERRTGQQPTNLFLGAVHYLLLSEPANELAQWYPSITTHPRPARTVEPVFRAFCRAHRDELVSLMRQRLVQTNEIARAIALRYGLAAVATNTHHPITLVEVGASAGLLLAFDRYGTDFGGRSFGDQDAPLTLTTDWQSETPPPDLDALPPIQNRFGIDLHPIDPTEPEERLWLTALVWPGERDRALQLEHALDALTVAPPRLLAGDAVDLLPRLDNRLSVSHPLVIFHAATMGHNSRDRRQAFDTAISALAVRRPVFRLSLESPCERIDAVRHLPPPLHVLTLQRVGEQPRHLAAVDGHVAWMRPL